MAPGHAVAHADGTVQSPIRQVWVEPDMIFGNEFEYVEFGNGRRIASSLGTLGFGWF